MRYDIYFDGGCHNDGSGKGIMGVGVYARRVTKVNMMGKAEEWEDVFKHGFNAGEGTNNVAEWIGLREAMVLSAFLVLQKNATEINIYSDSQLVVKQYAGDWKITGGGDPEKRKLFLSIRETVLEIENDLKHSGRIVRGVFWIPRELNTEADKLSWVGREDNGSKQTILDLAVNKKLKDKFTPKF